jgi:hypothetical protein
MGQQMSDKPEFDFSLVTDEQAIALQAISKLLSLRTISTTDDVLGLGSDLFSAWRVCKKDETLFTLWCESEECPFSVQNAKSLIRVYQWTPDDKIGRGFLNERMVAEVAYDVLNSDF